MKPRQLSLALPALLLLPAVLAMGCSAVSKNSLLPPGVSRQPAQPLANQHRVSKVPTPSECLPTCKEGLTKLRNALATTPTSSASPASAASAPTTQ